MRKYYIYSVDIVATVLFVRPFQSIIHDSGLTHFTGAMCGLALC